MNHIQQLSIHLDDPSEITVSRLWRDVIPVGSDPDLIRLALNIDGLGVVMTVAVASAIAEQLNAHLAKFAREKGYAVGRMG